MVYFILAGKKCQLLIVVFRESIDLIDMIIYKLKPSNIIFKVQYYFKTSLSKYLFELNSTHLLLSRTEEKKK